MLIEKNSKFKNSNFYSKPIFLNIFQVGAFITNYLHQHYMNLTYEVIMEHNPDLNAHGWGRNY